MKAPGLALAGASVLLVSAAQLAMRWSMTRLPGIDAWQQFLTAAPVALAMLALGICGYALSMVCWMGALNRLPLNRAYSLLALSYPLVYVGAALLPGLGGSLSLGRTLGVLLILLGVLLVNARRASPPVS
ncbi:4-amino-4-deoxy-L-arabinose-phosphoundecaprenol flippase subunit ArnF [Xylophilus sp. GW821-FHT01B05]